MRICLVGAHGTGKSTLGPLVAAALKATDKLFWEFIPEVAREVLNEKKITENLGLLPVEKIMEVQSAILEKKLQMRLGRVNTVEDRHPYIDVFAYSTYWLSRHPTASEFLSKMQSEVEDSLFFSDELIIVVPPNIPLDKDGVRAETDHFRNTIHYITLGILEKSKKQYKVLGSNTPASRLYETLKVYKDWLILNGKSFGKC